MSATYPTRLRMIYPIYVTGQAVSHITLSLCRHMANPELSVTLTSAGYDATCIGPVEMRAPPAWLFRLLYRLRRDVRACTEGYFQRHLAPGDVAYLWPTCSLDLHHRLKQRGYWIVKETINCHQALAKTILDQEYDRQGLEPTHGLTEADIAKERAELALADAIFAPSPLVADSLRAQGVDPAKIMLSSYGWDPRRIQCPTAKRPPRSGPVTVLFVGRACLRKGIHLLLRVWEKLRRPARLVIAGRIDQEILDHYGQLLAREDVRCLGHCRDITSVFSQADIFAFPSLEEGSPLVSYEALAAGLPMMISPMGAGAVVRHECEGLVCDPHDEDAWVAGLGRLLDDADLRHAMGLAARRRAEAYTWEHVGHQRYRQLHQQWERNSQRLTPVITAPTAADLYPAALAPAPR